MLLNDRNPEVSEIYSDVPETNNIGKEKKPRKPQAVRKPSPEKLFDLEMWYDNADLKFLLNVSDSSLYRYRKHNLIPFTKVGGKFLYPREYFKDGLMFKLANKHLIPDKE